MLGNHALSRKPLITQLTEMSLIRRIQAIIASSTLIGNMRRQLLLTEKVFGTFGTFTIPGRVIPSGAELREGGRIDL